MSHIGLPMTSRDVLDLAKQVHATAHDKLWWKTNSEGICVLGPGDLEEKNFLIVTELAEAFEEYRKPESRLDRIYFDNGTLNWREAIEATMMAKAPLSPAKPEGFPVELADAVIRILDLMMALSGDRLSLGEVVDGRTVAETSENVKECQDESFARVGTFMFRTVGTLVSIGDGDLLAIKRCLWEALELCERYALSKKIPLGEALMLKIAYNASRPSRHGGKRA